jgi:[ribosomal protein S5]-alanine N-acetyltransferase
MIVLESERMYFRAHEPGDRDAYCAMEMDAEVRRWVGGQPRTREAAELRFRGALKPVEDRLALWATVLKAEGQYIGRCGLYPRIDPGIEGETIVSGEATLAFYLAAGYWGRGLATEAGAAFIDFGFQQLELAKIVAHVEVGNDASVRVLEKLGFSLASTETGQRSFYHFERTRPA